MSSYVFLCLAMSSSVCLRLSTSSQKLSASFHVFPRLSMSFYCVSFYVFLCLSTSFYFFLCLSASFHVFLNLSTSCYVFLRLAMSFYVFLGLSTSCEIFLCLSASQVMLSEGSHGAWPECCLALGQLFQNACAPQGAIDATIFLQRLGLWVLPAASWTLGCELLLLSALRKGKGGARRKKQKLAPGANFLKS